MMHSNQSRQIDDIRDRVRDLREIHGIQSYLTVVSGVVAEAYRLANMPGTEFSDLLQRQMEDRGRLLIHLRRKPIMRLRAGFDEQDGALPDDDGLVYLCLHFSGGSYIESNDRPGLHIKGTARSSLELVGGLNRPASSIIPRLPRCLQPRSIRTAGPLFDDPTWGGRRSIHVLPHWDTLSLMPAAIARELGLPSQKTLDQIPWLPFATPVRSGPAVKREHEKAAPALPRPQLRPVSSI